MLTKNNTFFSFENSVYPHFIIHGREDWTCNDDLQITSLNFEIYRALKLSGFEAVVFCLDRTHLMCYDDESNNLMRTLNVGAQTSSGNSASMGDHGPLPYSVAPQIGSADEHHTEVPDGSTGYVLNLIESACQNRLIRIITQNTVRCAVVFCDYSEIYPTFTRLSHVLNRLGEHENGHNNIAIYRFRETKNVFVNDENIPGTVFSLSGANPSWRNVLAQNVIVPGTLAAHETGRRHIQLGTPNAREIRNLLLRARLFGRLRIDSLPDPDDASPQLNIRYADIDDIAFKLADTCAKEHLGIVDLAERLNTFMMSRTEQLTSENYSQFLTEGKGTKYKTALDELESYIGQDEFKKNFRQLAKSIDFENAGGRIAMPRSYSKIAPHQRAEHSGVKPQDRGHSLNVMLKGEPGTGKTTFARLIGRLYREMGVLPQGHVVEVSAGSLLAENEGTTARRVHERVMEAIGGVLFVDEVYSLLPGEHGSTNLGTAAVNQLVNDMSSYAGQLAFVFAGYEEHMKKVMKMNEGLPRRFPNNFRLVPYNGKELKEIFVRLCRKRGYTISAEVTAVSDIFFDNWARERQPFNEDGDHDDWGNAGEVETLVEKLAVAARAEASEDADAKPGKVIIKTCHFPDKLKIFLKERTSEDLEKAMDAIIGLENVKARLRDIVNTMKIDSERKQPIGGYVFYGRPGSGKSMMADIFAELLWDAGLIKRRTPVVVKAKQLISKEIKLEDAVRRARGSILFIDEAHQLNEDTQEARTVLTQLVPYISDDEVKMDTGFVLAGYRDKLEAMLDNNNVEPGLSSRFPVNNRMLFADYSAEELTRILEFKLRKANCTTDDGHPKLDEFGKPVTENGKVVMEDVGTFGVLEDGVFRITTTEGYLFRSYIILRKLLEQGNKANGRFIENEFLQGSEAAKAKRLIRSHGTARGIAPDEQKRFTYCDTPSPDAMGDKRFIISDLDLTDIHKTPVEQLMSVIDKEEAVRYIIACGESSENTDRFADDEVPGNLIFAFTGPMGCGRSTLARAMARYLHSTGTIEYDGVRFFDKGNLEAGFVGQSDDKTASLLHSSAGNVIVFTGLDKYCETGGPGNKTFAQEVISAIKRCMAEMKKTCFVFMDTEEHTEQFFKYYPEMKSEMTQFIFHEYTGEQMYRIFREMTTRWEIAIDEETLRGFFYKWVSDKGGLGANSDTWQNGSEVEKLRERIKTEWERNHSSEDDIRQVDEHTSMRIIRQHHFPAHLQKYFSVESINAENVSDMLGKEIGMTAVKRCITGLRHRIELDMASTYILREADPELADRYLRERGVSVKPGHFLFIGNSGTGKTRMAKMFGAILKATGALKQGHVVSVTAASLAGQGVKALHSMVRAAKEGVFFIDEAHNLCNLRGGMEIVKELLTIVEDPDVTEHTAIILAGYENKMMHLFEMDEGLRGRFDKSTEIHFQNYTGAELFEIMCYMMENAPSIDNLEIHEPLYGDASFMRLARATLEYLEKRQETHTTNARYARNFLSDCYNNMTNRLFDGGAPSRTLMTARPKVLSAVDIQGIRPPKEWIETYNATQEEEWRVLDSDQ